YGRMADPYRHIARHQLGFGHLLPSQRLAGIPLGHDQGLEPLHASPPPQITQQPDRARLWQPSGKVSKGRIELPARPDISPATPFVPISPQGLFGGRELTCDI